MLKNHEGLSLDAYPEADYWLIGYGHKGEDVHGGMSISALTAERFLREDLRTREDYIRSMVEVPLNENEFSALVILSYNIGNGAFRNSTVLRLLNDGNLKESIQLTNRRILERNLFLAG